MRHNRTVMAIGLVATLGLVAAAGGEDDGDETVTTAEETPVTSASAAPTEASSVPAVTPDCSLDETIKLVFLWNIAGEDAQSVDDTQFGAQMAVDEINAAGGVCGQPIEAVRIPTSPTDVQAATASFLGGVDENPVAIFGPAASGPTIAMAPMIEEAAIPFLSIASSPTLGYGDEAGSQWMWLTNTSSDPIVAAGVEYFVDELGFTNIGVMATDLEVGVEQIAYAEELLAESGITPVATRTFPFDTQDMTEQVLAMDGAEGILNYGYPANIALQLTQSAQNDISVPVVGNAAVPFVISGGLVDDNLLGELYAAVTCESRTSENPRLVEVAQNYLDQHGSLPGNLGLGSYDGVYILKAAIEAAGSVEPEALNAALGEVEVSGLACQSTYKADGAHYMAHELNVVRYVDTATAEIAYVYNVPEQDQLDG